MKLVDFMRRQHDAGPEGPLEGDAATLAASQRGELIAMLERADVRVFYLENELIDVTREAVDVYKKFEPTGWYAVGLLIRRPPVPEAKT